ncbi:hypothetical protein CONCODRAFT_13406 [Conidiobolus coronatus NRRL 28638]|uniref:Condensin complex subunit 2 n=1 Tax=Conidiobolus coronatus (strain ATCC 28846 / CBS 209.66 / NRRL 28638) TaxID=796925 RepID=A0A137NQS1_CONC2|nr:hypothetical protein CONCODRAFT_13406 [Conidiobolus coronatus NRRL 28638]|eukprot:KXN65113.1 hypothetical protein CONCODRAFT_13406 [Conidiobolus coronatus NRRL 28638]
MSLPGSSCEKHRMSIGELPSTSADFDEGGARELLLKHLSIQGDGRMIFDSGDAAITEDGSVPVQPLVTESVDRDFLELDSLTYLIFNQDSPHTTLDFNNLKPNEISDNKDDDYVLQNEKSLIRDDGPVGDKSNYPGWAGPEHWRVKGNRNKDTKNKQEAELRLNPSQSLRRVNL